MGGSDDGTDRDRLRRHFEIERELADRLRAASKEARQELYAEVYEELFRRVEIPGNQEAQKAQVGLLLDLVGPFVEGRSIFLEIGAGSCDLSLALAGRMDRVWAVDAVDPGIAAGSTPAGFRFVTARDLRGTVPMSSIDVALSCHFVEHLHPEDLHDHLTEIFDLLVEGGAYLVVTPNRIYGPHDVSKGFTDEAVGLHLREYTHADLAREFRRAGFADVRAVGRLGELPRKGRLGAIATIERLFGVLPGRLRRAVVEAVPRHPPFRPLEQVKLVGFKGRRP